MKLVILGGGESGTGAALLGKKLGYEVFLSDKKNIDEVHKAILVKEAIPFEEGVHTEERILAADLVVKSPGIPDTVPMIKALRAKGIEVISEIELAGRHSDAIMICITGSNGKTTTTLLIHHILVQAGMDAGLAGNVGHSLAAQVAENAHPLYVVELSSFQLDGMFRFQADIAVLTNVTPDHLDRYDYKFENYVNSKFRILNNMGKEGLFIYGYDCEVVRQRVIGQKLLPQAVPFTYGGEPDLQQAGGTACAYMEGDTIVVRLDEKVFRMDKNDVSIKGRHNVYNAMAAILACMRAGVDPGAIAAGLKSFPQVEHRLETVAVVAGVTYINDSKATNVDSAWYALDSMTHPVVWIAGGTDKGNDYTVLYELVKQKVKALVCMGVDNRKLIENFSGICPVADTHSLEEALAAVQKYACEGDTVLLSPCCASFDLFKNYEQRGELFKEKVRQLK
ncbi:UDP-N-acetylmuramoylalanine--D-glutamate ligase [Odoribacter laneus]|jgi:UDP-N-acetylmuramoyl-L-alanine--D-glutamate ligase|uniref:UDP-N-acetylmuramoyl-L-alanine--D-glutamate ligase n=1 Tax=Odoribacter laneus TaxID=626933 RepID=UPI00033D94E1|nr:UDP-N-acetylmuramoyl-L-alanine--D-glutamate ligase [Odoribacter laneus]GKI21821.1 UDP-N-acetylmuramoylalanine--D-glutamate ligase [Odoribacter laneus]GKI26403.1 UDP-N-acetylmuramoylalanine--D-glutamate ligase [Odoribacter laneus]CCZ82482.1 uDP-N-acetylmuramoylalanine--D-glutamate ligase [Odoribacter laneus CAG:561]